MDEIVAKIHEVVTGIPGGATILLVLGVLGTLCVVASTIVALTPSKADDKILESIEKGSISGKVWQLLQAFSVIRRK